jgi:uncharacterized protein (DUF983 family)
MPDPAPEDFDMGLDDDCPNCGGEGVIYMCVSEYACVDPESGCDLCERRCDWCQTPPAPQPREVGADD